MYIGKFLELSRDGLQWAAEPPSPTGRHYSPPGLRLEESLEAHGRIRTAVNDRSRYKMSSDRFNEQKIVWTNPGSTNMLRKSRHPHSGERPEITFNPIKEKEIALVILIGKDEELLNALRSLPVHAQVNEIRRMRKSESATKKTVVHRQFFRRHRGLGSGRKCCLPWTPIAWFKPCCWEALAQNHRPALYTN